MEDKENEELASTGMNVFQKLLLARCKFQEQNVKKSGKNAYYEYFELDDIIPVCNLICAEVKAVCVVLFNKEDAELNFIDCENPENFIRFKTPMSTADLKNCHAVQNLGAVQTYLKRYLYMHCFEIAEHDGLDGIKQFTIDENAMKLINYIWEHKANLGVNYQTALDCFKDMGDCEAMYHRCVKFIRAKEEADKKKAEGEKK